MSKNKNTVDISKDLIRKLHVRSPPFRNVFIANVVTAFILFILLVTSLLLMIIEGSTSHSKAIVDYLLSTFFFIAVVLLIVADMFSISKTRGVF